MENSFISVIEAFISSAGQARALHAALRMTNRNAQLTRHWPLLAPPHLTSREEGTPVASRGAVGTPAGSAQAQGLWETKGAPHFLTPRMFASRRHSTCSLAFSVMPKDCPPSLPGPNRDGLQGLAPGGASGSGCQNLWHEWRSPVSAPGAVL